MGHGDEIVLADANFPSSSIGQRVIRADGIGTAELLAAILPLFFSRSARSLLIFGFMFVSFLRDQGAGTRP